MMYPPPTVHPSLAHAQQHLLKSISEGTGLTGTVEELGAWAGITRDDLNTCINALRDAGWIAVQQESSGLLRLRLGRR
jgi:biotin operon repressor